MRLAVQPMLRFLILTLALAAAGSLRAEFTDTLGARDRAASGLDRLTPAQTAALNVMVDRDETLARQGGVTGFASSFTSRLSRKDIAATGLDALTGPQKAALDSLVAFTLAHPEPEVPHYKPHPTATVAKPSPRPPVAPPIVFTAPRPEVHGELSFMVGGGKGGSFYGSSFDATVVDPAGRWAFSVGISQYHGKGWASYYPPWRPYGAYPGYSPLWDDPFGPPYPLKPFDLDDPAANRSATLPPLDLAAP